MPKLGRVIQLRSANEIMHSELCRRRRRTETEAAAPPLSACFACALLRTPFRRLLLFNTGN